VPAPWGAGAHPYLWLGTSRIDELVLQVPARQRYRNGPQQEPVGIEPVAETPFDFREPRRLGGATIDHAFADLARDGDGRAVARLALADGSRGVDLWMDPAYRYVMVFTGDTLADPARRRRGIAIEPMTCPPNAFQTGTDVIRLEPGESHTATWGISPW
jgi:galactose mutarotase-like enzyme